ncbi:hypothetical protein ACWFNE_10385 [Cellulomonas sp. NPDC055163]
MTRRFTRVTHIGIGIVLLTLDRTGVHPSELTRAFEGCVANLPKVGEVREEDGESSAARRAPDQDAASWPPLGSEPRDWISTVDPGHLTVWERHRIEQPYRSALVPLIAEEDVRLPVPLQALQQDAAAEVARFDTEVAHLPVPMPAVLLRTESASSSQIEHLTSSSRNIALAELGATDKANAGLIVANTRAMQLTLASGDEVTADVILRAHDALLAATDPDVAGR